MGRLLLTIDVGVAGCGACLYDIDSDSIYRAEGVITYREHKLKVTIDDLRRLGLVLDFLKTFRDEGPLGIAFECPAGGQSASAAAALATGRTTAFVIAYDDAVPWKAYSVGDCKKAVGLKGNGKKEKKVTQGVVTARWPMAKWPLGEKNFEDACDAAAVILAAEQDGFIDFLRDKWKHLK